jgi:hypothetical protein
VGRRSVVLATICVALASACALVSGVGDLVVDDGSTGGGTGSGEGDAAPDVRIVERPDGGTCGCLPVAPPGWRGPVSVWIGGGAAPPCGGDYGDIAVDAFEGLDAQELACKCTCTASNPQCPVALTVDLYEDPLCVKKCDTLPVTHALGGAGTCADVQRKCFDVRGVSVQPQGTATCTPSPSSPPPSPPTWKENVRACAATSADQGACNGGELCLDLPAAPMKPSPCIVASGDVACPAGVYSAKALVYGSWNDTRECSPCGCGAPNVACAAQFEDCRTGGGPLDASAPTNCAPLPDPNGLGLTANPVPGAASCPADGGVPTGAATPTSPTTLCCYP